MTVLNAQQIAHWQHHGFLHPFPMLDQTEIHECLDGIERYEAWLGEPISSSKDHKCRAMPYLILPWVASIARDPRILDVVEELIGPDILIWMGAFFVKEPESPMITAWHQDATYFGLKPPEPIAVWLALTDASEEAGCMEVLPMQGEKRQMSHVAHVVENSVNRAAQVITDPLDESAAIAMPLKAGEFSIHHGLTPHRSAPNITGKRRIGLGLNYLPTHVRPNGVHRTVAMLVRGEDKYGHFELVNDATEEMHPDAQGTHERAVRLYRETYKEQEALHKRQYISV